MFKFLVCLLLLGETTRFLEMLSFDSPPPGNPITKGGF